MIAAPDQRYEPPRYDMRIPRWARFIITRADGVRLGYTSDERARDRMLLALVVPCEWTEVRRG